MYIVFDIGGTKMRLAASRDGEHFDEPIVVDTPEKFDDAVERFRELTRDLARNEHVEGLAGGIRGPLSRDKSTLLSEIHLTDWVGRPIRETISSACAAPVYLENDTALVGLGESVVGAGREGRIVAYITVSTGVGGSRIVDKKIDEVSIGFEPGKQIIDPDHTLCPECPGVTLEAHISGTDVEARFGKPPYEITDDKIWHEISEYCAIGVLNTIVHWSPNVVVLGGSMVVGDSPGIIIEDVQRYVKEHLTVFPEVPSITAATLKGVGGLHGALVYLKQRLRKES